MPRRDSESDEPCPLSYNYRTIKDLVTYRIQHKKNGIPPAYCMSAPGDSTVAEWEEAVNRYSLYFDAIMGSYIDDYMPCETDSADEARRKHRENIVIYFLLRYLAGESINTLKVEEDAQCVDGVYFHDALLNVVSAATRAYVQKYF